MFANVALALAPVGLILVASEILWRKNLIKGEKARKFIHILAGCWIAFWPLYLPFDGIFILGCVALTLLIYSRFTSLFHAIYAVKRKTYGDLLFALAIIVCAYYAQADWIFILSILLLALADGGAAIVGRFWGSKNTYYVFGSKSLKKSINGTATFVLLAYVSIAVGLYFGGNEFLADNPIRFLVVVPLVATIAENTMPFGFDNFFTPLSATLILNGLVY